MRSPRRALLAALAACLLAPAAAGAAAGDLDPAFSGDGRVALTGAGPFVVRALAVQPDGKLLLAGSSCAPAAGSDDATCLSDGSASFRIARLTSDGGLDPEFGDNGLVTTPVGSGRSQALDVLALANGSIVAGGTARDGQGRDVLALARYDARGALDPAFGSGGVALQRIGDGFAAIGDLAPGPNGTILATGQAGAQLLVARFTAAGALDPGFGTGGTVVAGTSYGFGLGIVPTTDGSVVAVGIAGDSADAASFRFGELRLTPGGLVDGGFGIGGFAEQRAGTGFSYANAAAAMPDGGWIAAGAGSVDDGRQAFTLVRGGPGDEPVPRWTTQATSGAGAVATDVAALPGNRIVAAGQVTPTAGGLAFGVARFGTGGAVQDFSLVQWDRFPFARATAVAVQPDGRVVSAGIGCAGGGTGMRCSGGSAVALVARQLGDPPVAEPTPTPTATPTATPTPAPARLTGRVRTARRITRRTLRRRGLPVRVTSSAKASLVLRLRGPHGGRLATVRLRIPRRVAEFRVKVRKPVAPGRLRLEARLTDRRGLGITVRTHTVLR